MPIYIRCIVVSFLLCVSGCLFAQDYPASIIPDSLKVNANSVIRNYSMQFIQSDANNGTYKVNKVITILNEKGSDFAVFYTYEDKFRTITNFSGVVRDASGKIIKKIKKSDFHTSSMSDNALANDNIDVAYEYKSPSYPFTIEYTYEVKYKNGILHYPAFFPVAGYTQSVEKADYSIQFPSDRNIRYRTFSNCTVGEQEETGKKVYNMSLTGFKAIEKESFSPPVDRIFPAVEMSPSDFCYDSHCGNMSDWKNYGLWAYGLLKDRDQLSPEMVEKIKSMTSTAKDNREKVEILYKYLQDNMRYVSIQFGIGGFQPFKASEVAKTKFGDCKGLTNLMKAMLKVVDIPSDYCEIRMGGEKNLQKDFSSMSQTNHVILLVPFKNDSIWLECTSKEIPFGYVHDDIAGHDALLITENGGLIRQLPGFSDKENKEVVKMDYQLNEDGSIDGKLSITKFLEYSFGSTDRNDYIKYVNKKLKLPQSKIAEIKTSENKTNYPSINLTTDFHASDFANITGTRMFLPLCPINKGQFNMFSASKRNLDIHISQGYSETDTIIISLPDSYVVESLPKNVDVESRFGRYSTNIEQVEGKIIYVQNIDIFTGEYDKSLYSEIKRFFSRISSELNKKVVVKKQ